ncbi:hypothetical protein GGH95_000018 [Coemansia sp. RSA 1836]|nr:hypothetical protein GGH95_000018 [Coemansia sp. RSA 1836]
MDFGFFLPPSADDNTRQPSLAEVASAAAAQLSAMSQVEQQPSASTAIPPASKPPANKPIGMACRACRLRKIRCGGELPRCTYCVKKGYECVLTPHKKRGRPRKAPSSTNAMAVRSDGSEDMGSMMIPEDMPMPLPLAAPIDASIEFDVRQLWAELTGLQGMEFPPELSALADNIVIQEESSSAVAAANIPYIGPSFNLGLTLPGSPTAMTAAMTTTTTAAAAPVDMDPLQMFASNYAFPPSMFDPMSPAGDMSVPSSATQPAFGFIPFQDTFSATTASHDDQQQQQQRMANRPARSSNTRMESPGSATSSSILHSGKQQPQQQQQPPQQIREIDEGIRQYFVYVHPWMPILHRPTFERQITDGTVDPLLYYAVQAIASRFGNNTGSKPYKSGQRFARAARRLLPQSLKPAKLSTLQAVALLSLYMSVSGQWQAGAAYERLAVQLAFVGQYHLLDEEFLLPPVTNNLGLFEAGWSEHSHPARLEVLSRPGGILEHEQRRRAWWAVFQLERFNGLAMGRPPIIKPGWHWVWLPCADDLWARENPSGTLAWELGLADSEQRPAAAVSACRVDLVLALIMGQITEQRTDLFRLFFPRVDRGTLFHDNLPTHELDWPQRLHSLAETVGALERRIGQWHVELDRYADQFSARRHANLEIMGASCQIHLHACVLQIREHLFEDLLISEEVRAALNAGTQTPGMASGAQTPVGGGCGSASEEAGSSVTAEEGLSRSSSGVDFSAMFERQTGVPFDRSTYQRGYMAKAKRPPMTMQFVEDLDILSQRCWDRSVAMSDETARLLRVHWLRALNDHHHHHHHQANDGIMNHGVFADTNNNADDKEESAVPPAQSAEDGGLDPLIADRFKLMNPQTPYHLFVAGKVQAARLKQAVTAQARHCRQDNSLRQPGASASTVDVDMDEAPEVREAIRRINDIWDKHALDADASAIESRLDDIITALEYCQLFWFSLNFASHLKYLKREASKPLLHAVYRE